MTMLLNSTDAEENISLGNMSMAYQNNPFENTSIGYLALADNIHLEY